MIDSLSPLDSESLTTSMGQGKVDEMQHLVRRGELLKASQEFESYFLSYLLKVMRDTVPKGPLTANRMGDMFNSFYDAEIGKRAAQVGGIGLSEYMLASLAHNDGLEHRAPSPNLSSKF